MKENPSVPHIERIHNEIRQKMPGTDPNNVGIKACFGYSPSSGKVLIDLMPTDVSSIPSDIAAEFVAKATNNSEEYFNRVNTFLRNDTNRDSKMQEAENYLIALTQHNFQVLQGIRDRERPETHQAAETDRTAETSKPNGINLERKESTSPSRRPSFTERLNTVTSNKTNSGHTSPTLNNTDVSSRSSSSSRIKEIRTNRNNITTSSRGEDSTKNKTILKKGGNGKGR